MSFIYSNKLQFDDTPNLDAFGRLRTSNVTSLLEYKHTFDKQPLLIDEIVNGAGATSSHNPTYSQVEMSVTNSGEYVIRQSKSRGIYQPGKGQIFEASIGNFQLETDVIKRVGYFSSTTSAPYNSGFDGFFLESNGPLDEISFQIYARGNLILSAPTSTWSSSELDPSSIDWSKTQLLLVDFQWLGVGRLRFCLVFDGIPIVFVTNSGTNNLTTVYMKSPNQPVRYEIRSSGGTGTFNMICSQVSLEGTINSIQKSVFIDNFTVRTLATAGTKYPLIGYRINSNYAGVNITLSDIQTLNITSPSKADFYVTVELNPVLSATPTFNNITNSPVDYALGTGAQTVTTSGHRIAGFLGSGAAIQVDSFEFKDNVLRPGTGINGTADQVWICVVASLNNQDLRTAINISYFE
jgi:hypothetical protein